MPRIRTIKPEFWTDEKIVELSLQARLLFIGLWNLCDDHGRMEYSAKRIKLQLFPADKFDIAKICAELREKGVICVYASQGHEYLQVYNFRKHQQIKDGERASKFPEPTSEDLRNIAPLFAQNYQEGKGKEGKGKETLSCGAPPHGPNLRDQAKEVIDFLNEKCGKNFEHVDANTALIAARIGEGRTVQHCKSVIAMKRREWLTDPKMNKYLRPATLFAKENFAQYFGELGKEEQSE